VARAAEDAGVTLVLELLNSKVDHQDYQGDRTAWGIKVCALVRDGRVTDAGARQVVEPT
jgi:hydroxypyruvate isomerase